MTDSTERGRSGGSTIEKPSSADQVTVTIDETRGQSQRTETNTRDSQDPKISNVSKQVQGFDANTYAGKKTVTQALFDLALISANASHLKLVLQHHWAGMTPDFFAFVVTMLVLSIVLQLVTAVILFMKIRLDINNKDEQSIANRFNDCATLMVVFVTIINIFISAFSSIPSTLDTVDETVGVTPGPST